MSAGSIRLLLVAASAGAIDPIERAVAARGGAAIELLRVADVDAAMGAVEEDRYDTALLDLGDAVDAGLAELAWLHEHAPDLPIIVLTDGDDEALAVRALKGGAQDSLVKSEVDGNLLVRAVRYAIERHQLHVALRAMSLVDDLTGLYNRRGFLTLARQHLRVADRMRRRVSHIFVDLDGLKAINDTLGHREGDLALVEAADLLKATFRESDIIARIGGDEFVVLAMENAGAAPEQWSERLQENLRARNALPGRRFPLSLSTGVTYYDPDFPCPIDDLLERADSLMYQEKRSKRGSAPAAPRHAEIGGGATPVAPRAD